MDQEESLHKLQAEELEILLVIDEMCSTLGITYFLMSGTVLGAARHDGFIPWDDDIDIGMLREDYDRFLELAPHGLPAGYSLHTTENTPGFPAFFAKVYRDGTVFQTAEAAEAGCPQAIFVDVFPFDRAPDSERALRRLCRKAIWYQHLSYLWHSATITVPNRGALGGIERAACRLAHYVVQTLFNPKEINRRFEGLVDRASISEGGRYLVLSWPYVAPIDKSVLVPPAHMLFEGHDLPVPALCEEYLEIWYGDWRKLPPENKRHTHLPERIVFSDGSEWKSEEN